MRILFVEDNKTFAERIARSLRSIEGVNSVDICESRDAAVLALEQKFYDLIILDLTIPTVSDGLDTAPEHGQSVFYRAIDITPGTPICILTGSDPDEFSLRLVRLGRPVDPWGTGYSMPAIDYHVKERADSLVDDVSRMAGEVTRTDSITIDTRGRTIDLSVEFKRALRAFARLHGGASCLVERLSGGLSEDRVVRVTVKDGRGSPTTICVAKLGVSANIDREAAAYETYVKRLRIGAATPLLQLLDQGLRAHAGIFYSLAEGYELTLFEVALSDPSAAARVAGRVREGLGRWQDAGTLEMVRVGDIRQRLLSDSDLESLKEAFDLTYIFQVEDMTIRATRSCVHGDLHGGNVLVSLEETPLLIDFGDVGPGFSCLDPVTLELSMLFHPDGTRIGLAPMLEGRIQYWPDIESYLDGNPLGRLIQVCRDWAHDVGGGDQAVLAAGYAFALRQLKYETVDPALTLRLLRNIVDKLLAAT